MKNNLAPYNMKNNFASYRPTVGLTCLRAEKRHHHHHCRISHIHTNPAMMFDFVWRLLEQLDLSDNVGNLKTYVYLTTHPYR